MRQDPDVILVGEIRDLETAEIAIQASLLGTWYLVRFIPMTRPQHHYSIEGHGDPDVLDHSDSRRHLAQRLVRRICANCREETEVSREILMDLGIAAEDYDKHKYYRGAGCNHCNNTGYKGVLDYSN